MADGTPVPDGPGRPILGPWPPFGLRFPRFFPTLLKKHFVRRNGLFSFFQPKCPCFSALFQLPQVLLTGVRANQLRFTKQDSKSFAGDSVWVRVPPPAPCRVVITDLVITTRFLLPSEKEIGIIALSWCNSHERRGAYRERGEHRPGQGLPDSPRSGSRS